MEELLVLPFFAGLSGEFKRALVVSALGVMEVIGVRVLGLQLGLSEPQRIRSSIICC